MKTYIITEKQNSNCCRDGVGIKCKSLRSAKNKATRSQVWCGTILGIEDKDGNLLASKKDGGLWVNE